MRASVRLLGLEQGGLPEPSARVGPVMGTHPADDHVEARVRGRQPLGQARIGRDVGEAAPAWGATAKLA